jgi:uncharacterized repeat protein (TIGR03803 family)
MPLIRTAILSIAIAATASPGIADERVIYSFSSYTYYRSGVMLDGSGNLYGTDYALDGEGAVYRLNEKSKKWVFEVVHDFNGTDGASPSAALIKDNALDRVFYGVTGYGGSGNSGTVFSLEYKDPGWTDTVLHSFQYGADGVGPAAPLWQDKATGALYGTAGNSGTDNCGAAFEVTPAAEHGHSPRCIDFKAGMTAAYR